MLFTDEVKNMQELVEKLSDLNSDIDKIKVAVVCFIFDKNNNLILNRRGPGARDEIGKVQALGGSVNNSDVNFREAILREIKEEGGSDAVVRIDSFVGAQLDGKVDKHTGEFINWVILAYKGTLVEGELINAEPDRSVGLEKNTMEKFLNDDLSVTAYNFIKHMIDTGK